MKRYLLPLILCVIIAVFLMIPALVSGQDTGVFAEAVGTANLRARPDVNADQVGEIAVGIRYPVIGRSEFYPWVLLGQRETYEPMGWVFDQLVTVFGNIYAVPVSTLDVSIPPTPTPTPVVVATQAPAIPTVDGASTAEGPVVTPFVTATLGSTATPYYQVSGLVSGEINLRYGPGVEYPVVGRAVAGDMLYITAYHSQVPWYQIRYEASPNGFAWVSDGVVEVRGNIYNLDPITSTNFNLPTLTPTPHIRQSVGLPGVESIEPSPAILALGDRMWDIILDADFVPGTQRFGAVYLQDLQTGEAITFGNEIAFSGTSINKVAILVRYFGALYGQPNLAEAVDIANTMICSENVATNRLLGIVGQGDQILGAEETTRFLQVLGLTRTFLTAPYEIPSNNPPTPPPRPVTAPITDADQTVANPNPTNQMTVEEMGWLLGTIYECAYNESGPLLQDEFDGMFTPQECRKMLYVMGNNTVDALLKAGVPSGIRVAHKHGWINDTHGNAAVMFTPGGDYVLVMMLFQPEWLSFTDSLPIIAEVSREVYNYYNPTEPLLAVRDGYIPTVDECNYTADNSLVSELAGSFFMSESDTSQFFNPTATPAAGD
jgi:beta-lactamase class A/uncharacterized protein YraI